MHVQQRPFQSGLFLSTIQPSSQEPAMQSQLKQALMTTAVVLASMYVLNQVSFTRNIVQKAIA